LTRAMKRGLVVALVAVAISTTPLSAHPNADTRSGGAGWLTDENGRIGIDIAPYTPIACWRYPVSENERLPQLPKGANMVWCSPPLWALLRHPREWLACGPREDALNLDGKPWAWGDWAYYCEPKR